MYYLLDYYSTGIQQNLIIGAFPHLIENSDSIQNVLLFLNINYHHKWDKYLPTGILVC